MGTKHRTVMLLIRNNGEVGAVKRVKPSSIFSDCTKAVLLLWILFVISVSCHTALSVPCSLAVPC